METGKEEAMELLLEYFRTTTYDLLDGVFWSDEEDRSSALEAIERLKAYLSYKSGPENADIPKFLLDSEYDGERVENFFKRYPELDLDIDPGKFKRSICREKILDRSLRGTLELLENVLRNDEDDPHYSAVTAEHRIQAYLVCKNFPGNISVKSFLENQGYTAAQIERFYREYRRECLWSYSREPRKPLYANEKLRVYEVEGIFVVAIRETSDNIKAAHRLCGGKALTPMGAQFTPSRQCVWTYHLKPLENGTAEALLHETAEKLQQRLGPAHAFVKLGKQGHIPAYITETGYLACFLCKNGKVERVERIDLLALPK